VGISRQCQVHIKLTSFQSIPTNQTHNSSTAKCCSQAGNENNATDPTS